MKEKKSDKEPAIWYDVNNPNLYRNLSTQEVFEWIESTNKFIWNSLSIEQQEKIIQDKIDKGKALLKDFSY